MKISELLSDESRWTKYAWARNAEGKQVRPCDSDAVAWSLGGAAIKCYGHDNVLLHDIHRKLNESVSRQLDNVDYWQDSEERTYAEVRDLAIRLGI